jgi:hypothetical protein
MSITDWHDIFGLPADWDQRTQITMISPPRMIKVPGQEERAAPRSNLVLSIVPATNKTSDAARDEFYTQTAAAVPKLDDLGRDSVTFADGSTGSQIVLEFPATPETLLRQTHLFRIDDGVLAQIVITVDAATEGEEEMLIEAALRYKPLSDS